MDVYCSPINGKPAWCHVKGSPYLSMITSHSLGSSLIRAVAWQSLVKESDWILIEKSYCIFSYRIQLDFTLNLIDFFFFSYRIKRRQIDNTHLLFKREETVIPTCRLWKKTALLLCLLVNDNEVSFIHNTQMRKNLCCHVFAFQVKRFSPSHIVCNRIP